jgi:hypothetical protein
MLPPCPLYAFMAWWLGSWKMTPFIFSTLDKVVAWHRYDVMQAEVCFFCIVALQGCTKMCIVCSCLVQVHSLVNFTEPHGVVVTTPSYFGGSGLKPWFRNQTRQIFVVFFSPSRWMLGYLKFLYNHSYPHPCIFISCWMPYNCVIGVASWNKPRPKNLDVSLFK